jgi:hypothetical protein
MLCPANLLGYLLGYLPATRLRQTGAGVAFFVFAIVTAQSATADARQTYLA